MTDLSQQPQKSYGDNKLRADQSDEERIRKAKQKLRDEYNKYKQNSSMKQNNNNNRGRAATPGTTITVRFQLVAKIRKWLQQKQ